MKHKEEDPEVTIKRAGEMWEAFKKTNYYDALESFAFEQIKELKDQIVTAAMQSRHEEARDLGQRLAGFVTFLNYIDDAIATRVETLQFERDQKNWEKQLPHRL